MIAYLLTFWVICIANTFCVIEVKLFLFSSSRKKFYRTKLNVSGLNIYLIKSAKFLWECFSRINIINNLPHWISFHDKLCFLEWELKTFQWKGTEIDSVDVFHSISGQFTFPVSRKAIFYHSWFASSRFFLRPCSRVVSVNIVKLVFEKNDTSFIFICLSKSKIISK